MSETSKFRLRRSHYCAAINCFSSRTKNCPVRSFFRFPKEEDRCLKWIENCRREDLRGKTSDALHHNYILCSKHFEDSQFMNLQTRNKLVWNAIPTLFNIPNPPLSIAEEKARGCPLIPPSPEKDESDDDVWEKTQGCRVNYTPTVENCYAAQAHSVSINDEDFPTESSATKRLNKGKSSRWASVVLTSQQLQCIRTRQTINRQRVQIWRLKKQVQALKSKAKMRHTVEDIIQYTSKYMSGVAYDFFASQLRMASKKDQGKRWTEEDKFFALMLKCISVEAYRLCSKVFSLPSIRCLQRWLKGFKQEVPDFWIRLKTFKQKLMQGTEDKMLEDRFLSSARMMTSSQGQVTAATTESILDSLVEAGFDSVALYQTLLSVNEQNGSYLDDDKLSTLMAATNVTADSSLPMQELTEMSSKSSASNLSSVVTLKRSRGPNPRYKNEHATRQKQARKVDNMCFEEEQPQIELIASLPSKEESQQSQEVHMELQSEHLTLDPQTFQLLASAGHLENGTTFTAVQEVNTEGTVTLTPITNGMPVTLASDTINLEIVTLDVAREAICELGITEQIV